MESPESPRQREKEADLENATSMKAERRGRYASSDSHLNERPAPTVGLGQTVVGEREKTNWKWLGIQVRGDGPGEL